MLFVLLPLVSSALGRVVLWVLVWFGDMSRPVQVKKSKDEYLIVSGAAADNETRQPKLSKTTSTWDNDRQCSMRLWLSKKRKHWNEWVQWGLIHKPQCPSHSLLYMFTPPLKNKIGKWFGRWQTSTVAQVSASSSVEKPGSHLKHAANMSFRPGSVLHTSTPIRLRLQQCVQNSPFQAFQCWTWDSLSATTAATSQW